MRHSVVWASLGLLLAGQVGRADPPPPRQFDTSALVGVMNAAPEANTALAANLRGFLLQALPDPLFTDVKHWGKKEEGPLGRVSNHGQWWKVKARAANPNSSLVVDISDPIAPEDGKKQFTLLVSLDTNVELERQHWVRGVRVFSGSSRARLRLKLQLRVESQMRLETKGLLPQVVFRLHVIESTISYDNLVVEHTAGVGGDAAKLLGDMFISSIKLWKPSLEQKLLRKANDAILKAADTREVKLGLQALFGSKNPK
jgi:hypothetical protein